MIIKNTVREKILNQTEYIRLLVETLHPLIKFIQMC